jgi:hypothetical protein
VRTVLGHGRQRSGPPAEGAQGTATRPTGQWSLACTFTLPFEIDTIWLG